MTTWVICASGPSIARADLSLLRDVGIIAVNCTWRLVPWANVLYAGDLQWWDRYGTEARAFGGERWTRDRHAAVRYGLHMVCGQPCNGLVKEPLNVSTGGNSGHQAINLSYHFGARKIVLLGFDMHDRDGKHWHPDHLGMFNAPANHIEQWRRNMAYLARDLAQEGIEVINATEGSALRCFKRATLKEALA